MLASLADVKRVLQLTDDNEARDAQLRASLAAIDDWISPSFEKLTLDGPQVEVFWDVYEDATLHMPATDVTITRVRAFYSPVAFEDEPVPSEMTLGSGFDLTDQGDILLRPSLAVQPFEGAYATRQLRVYSRVEVHYIGTGVVPRSVSEGVALLAAGYWKEGPAILSSITHEKIGDYEYWTNAGGTTSGAAVPAYVTRAMEFLNARKPKARVSVT